MGGKGNKVVAVQVSGFRETVENHSIPQQVRRALKDVPCAVLGVITSDMEIDHKNGKYNSEAYQDEDFQSFTKSVNDAKREHCKRCNATGCRFKASVLGYSVDFIEGDENSPTCQGCYWYDPQAFNRAVSANYMKK
jgi:MinD superfamily P-loop ATPase